MSNIVNIIIPCYNAMPFLVDTLKSAINQTYPSLEIIIIDDGSTDGSYEYAMGLKQNNLTVKRNRGKGASAARNYGLELSSGDYIQFLDADDLLSPDKIENQLSLLKSYPNRIAVCRTVHFYDNLKNGIVTDEKFLISTYQPQKFLLNLYGGDGQNHSVVGQHAWLASKNIISKAGHWDETLFKDQDGEFFCRVLMQSEGVVFEPKGTAYYRKHINGTNIANQNQRKYIESQLKALDSKAHQLAKYCHTEPYKNAFAMQYKILGIDAYPEFKEISRKALQVSKSLGGSAYQPVLGGKLIEMIKFSLGWKSAKLFRLFLHRMRNKLLK